MIMREQSKNASERTSLELAEARLKRAIEAAVDEPECAAGWIWMVQEVLAREIRHNPDKAEQLTLQAAEGWERQLIRPAS